jgi:hypothetical protein
LRGFDCPDNSFCGRLRRGRPEAVQVSPLSARRKSKDQIAVQLGMNGVNGACQSIVSHLRNFRRLDFVELGTGHNDDQRRVGSSEGLAYSPLEHAFRRHREFRRFS